MLVYIIIMLKILEHFDLKSMGHYSAEYITSVSEAMKIATVEKATRMGDPKFFDIPFEVFLSDEYSLQMANKIKRGEKTFVPRLNTGADPKETTHICVAD